MSGRTWIGAVAALLCGWAAAGAEDGPAASGAHLFATRCALCHRADDAGGGLGPGLAGLGGRKVGSADFPYSPALRDAGFTWDAARLDGYLADPQATVPGTRMPVKVEDAGDRAALIAYLATLAPPPAPAASPAAAAAPAAAPGAAEAVPRTGTAAFGDWRDDAPGVRRLIRPADLPPPFDTRSAGNAPRVVARPAGRVPSVPPGFRVALVAEGLDDPRVLRVAPNGDLFVAETASGRIEVMRAAAGGGRATTIETFAAGLAQPFGIAFYPPGPNPTAVYVAEINRVLRFPYAAGDLHARGPAAVIVPQIAATTGGHSTRDLAVAPDGSRLFVSVGSGSNVAQEIEPKPPAAAATFELTHGLGAAWGAEEGRADVLSFAPDGGERRVVATGLRNCVGLAVQPATGALWCSTNERDGLGDDLVPDYVTRVRAGAWYGWPWRYVGDHEEPRLAGARPDLQGRMTEPDVLLQPHSASLGLAFYDGGAFPSEYRGDAFAAEHGSWNRTHRTGYKVIRVRLRDGVPTGEYDDFMTGFVLDDRSVWGRPVGVAVDRDGALLVSEDANGTIWRVTWTGDGAAP